MDRRIVITLVAASVAITTTGCASAPASSGSGLPSVIAFLPTNAALATGSLSPAPTAAAATSSPLPTPALVDISVATATSFDPIEAIRALDTVTSYRYRVDYVTSGQDGKHDGPENGVAQIDQLVVLKPELANDITWQYDYPGIGQKGVFKIVTVGDRGWSGIPGKLTVSKDAEHAMGQVVKYELSRWGNSILPNAKLGSVPLGSPVTINGLTVRPLQLQGAVIDNQMDELCAMSSKVSGWQVTMYIDNHGRIRVLDIASPPGAIPQVKLTETVSGIDDPANVVTAPEA